MYDAREISGKVICLRDANQMGTITHNLPPERQ